MTVIGVAAPRVVEMTEVSGLAHLVSDDAMIAGRPAGRYVARCGAVVLAASLTTPEAGYCHFCTDQRDPGGSA